MKILSILLLISILLTYCATSNRMANKAFYHALIGQNELTVYARLGAPTNVIHSPTGEKILVYEYYHKGMFVLPKETEPNDGITIYNNKTGAVYDVKVYPENLNSRNTSYEIDINRLMVFFDQKGKCIRFEQDLPKERLDFYYERLKAYLPDN